MSTCFITSYFTTNVVSRYCLLDSNFDSDPFQPTIDHVLALPVLTSSFLLTFIKRETTINRAIAIGIIVKMWLAIRSA